jgi:hypothetical protein
MKLFIWIFLPGIFAQSITNAQSKREDIYSDFVLYQHRTLMEKDLRERLIGKTFAMPLDSNSEYKFELACSAVSQFLFVNADVENGFGKLFAGYDFLQYDTRAAFLEAVYAAYPDQYRLYINEILNKETDPELFSVSAVYLYRKDSSTENSNYIKIKLVEKFPGYDTIPVLTELLNYLSYHTGFVHQETPGIVQLFRFQQTRGQKIIYSLQRWNRDYPGIAIIQDAEGNFVRGADGRLLCFEQLARSGSDLPYFLTNGSTPQGVYRLLGTGIAHNNFIGPTPYLQMILPFENSWEKYFGQTWANSMDSLNLYRQLFPESWRDYGPMQEAWSAGKTGRRAIIAHGTTLDPEYFKGKPFYPFTPTQGCLCAKELWNPTSGKLLFSDEFNLVSAFQSSPGNRGYVYVINIDDQQKPVTRSEIELLVKAFESDK